MRPNTRQSLLDYCLRNLGFPVIEINVDEDQLDDRLDDALQYFAEYHFDGTEKVYLKYIVTQDDVNNGYINLSYSGSTPNQFIEGTGLSGQSADSQTGTETGQTSYQAKIEDTIISVLNVWSISTSTFGMFDVRYQYALNDLYTFGTIDLVNFTTTMSYLSLLQQMLSPDHAIRFSRKTNKLYIDMKWARDAKPGTMIVVEAYRIIDAKVAPEIYNDMLLKRYLTALIKRQWGANLSKYQNVQLLSGMTFNGAELWAQASEEIKNIEDTMQSSWESPPGFFLG